MHLTGLAHSILGQYLSPGQYAVDATVGNGHDSCFLAQQVGVEGKVFAFDIQQQALNITAGRLRERGLEKQVRLIHRGHQQLLDELPPDCRGKIQAAMFNLGYLPHGDKHRITTSSSTLPALEQAGRLLSRGGVISVLAYRGHPGGEEEATAVEQKLRELTRDGRRLSIMDSPGPVLFMLAPNLHD